MNVSVNIYTPDKDIGATIFINHIPDTNNYTYTITGNDEDGGFTGEGTIFNYEGDYLNLVREVLDGGTVHRKD